MYFLVHVGVLRDDESVQLAYENRIVPLPDVWWQSDTNANANTDAITYSNTDAYSDTNSDTNAYSNADACACSECAEQSGWKCRVLDSDQSVVDG